MDGVSAAASIVGIATAGIQVSIKVVTLASQISTAADRISSIGNDVSLTSAVLHQLGDLMSQKTTHGRLPVFNAAGLETTKSSAKTCQKIFEEVERETAKASSVIRGRKRPMGEKIKLTMLEKAKWPFLQPSLELLRTDLREAKGTLMLMLQLASLALSKRVADLNTSASSGMTEQRDIIRSVLMLKRQQKQDSVYNSDSHTEVFEDQERGRSETARDRENSSPQRPTSASLTQPSGPSAPIAGSRLARYTSIEDEEDQSPKQQNIPTAKTEVEVSKDPETRPIDYSSRNSSGMFTPSRTNSNGQKPRLLSLETQHLQGQGSATDPKSQDTAKAVKLRLFTIDPSIHVEYALVKIEWIWSDTKISEDEIRELIAQNKADGFRSVFAALQALNVFERSHVAGFVRALGDYVTLVSLKRTEQDLRGGNITLKAVPSFQLITEQPASKVKTTKPVFVKVLAEHICPETLDAYNLPWKWDARDPGYIIIKQWLPENDQDILFKHTRALRDRIFSPYLHELNELKRDSNKLHLVRRKSPTGLRRSRPWILGAERDQSSERETVEYLKKEGEKDESTEAEPDDESEENAAVDELLEKYTTFFERAS